MIYLNGNQVEFSKFPNGETSISTKKLRIFSDNEILLRYENDQDIILLMFLKKYIDDNEPVTTYNKLKITYMPYSRMDRGGNEFIFTLKYISKLINDLNFDNVIVYEPHSDVTPALLQRCTEIYLSLYLAKKALDSIAFDKKNDYIYFPDTTAEKRYSKHFEGYNIITGIKNRDFKTGHIKDLKVVGDINTENFKTLMVDDLCSRGGTFQLGAQRLKELGAKEIFLVVAHCENSIYEGDTFKNDLINKVFTSNSILTKFTEKSRLDVYTI